MGTLIRDYTATALFITSCALGAVADKCGDWSKQILTTGDATVTTQRGAP